MDASKRGMIRDFNHLSLLFKVFDVSVIYFSLYFLVKLYENVDWVPQYNLLALIAVLVFGFAAEIGAALILFCLYVAFVLYGFLSHCACWYWIIP